MNQMTFMEKEILEEPLRLADAWKENQAKVQEIAALIEKRKIRHIIVAGRGSSDNSATYFKYLCETVAGIPVGFAAPSVVTIYDGKLDLSDVLTIGVSQSGKAEDVLAVLNHAKKQGGMTIAITNYPNSPLAKAAEIHLWLNAGEEQSVAATKTFISQMYVFAMLVLAITKDPILEHQLAKVPHLLEETLRVKYAIARHTDAMIKTNDCYVIGRGFTNAVAHEFALKLQETTYIKALGYSTSDFHHGPFAMVDETTMVLLLAQDDKTMADSLDLIKKLKSTKAKIIAFTDNGELPVEEKVLLPKSHEYIAPFVFVLAGQMFALDLSQKRGNDPDKPRGLNKVTITK